MTTLQINRRSLERVGSVAFIISLLAACSGEDDTTVRQVQEAAEPTGNAGAGTGVAAPGAGGGGAASDDDDDDDDDSGSSGSGGAGPSSGEGGSGGIDFVPGGAPGQGGSAPEGEPQVEYWSNGVSVGGLGGTAEERFLGVAVDAADNVYAVGFIGAALGENRSMLIRKVDGTGQADVAFGASGSVSLDWSPYTGTPDDAATADVNENDASVEEAADVAVQSDGRIIVAGRVEDPTNLEPDATTPVDIVVFRLEPDGSLDTTFGDGGRVVLNPGGGAADLVYGIDLDSSDRIYVFGHGTTSDPARTDQDRYCWRLTVDGDLDATFGTDGVYTFDIPQGTSTLALNDNARRGVVLPSTAGGGVALGGYTNVAGRNQVVLVQLDDAGVPKPSFSGDGIVRLAPFPTGMAEAYGVAAQSDGSLVTTGYGNIDLERGGGANLLDMVSFRVRPDGSYDPSWGVNGAAVYDPAGAEDRGRALHALPDDRIVIAGTSTAIAGNKDAMLLLLDENGRPATDFAPGVHKSYDFGGTNEEFRAVDVSPNGTLLAAAGFSAGRADRDSALIVIVPILPAAE